MKTLKTFRLWTLCPHCGRRNELHDGEAQPVNGDVSFCIKCGQFGIYDLGSARESRLRLPSLQEAEEVMADAYFREIRQTWLDLSI